MQLSPKFHPSSIFIFCAPAQPLLDRSTWTIYLSLGHPYSVDRPHPSPAPRVIYQPCATKPNTDSASGSNKRAFKNQTEISSCIVPPPPFRLQSPVRWPGCPYPNLGNVLSGSALSSFDSSAWVRWADAVFFFFFPFSEQSRIRERTCVQTTDG